LATLAALGAIALLRVRERKVGLLLLGGEVRRGESGELGVQLWRGERPQLRPEKGAWSEGSGLGLGFGVGLGLGLGLALGLGWGLGLGSGARVRVRVRESPILWASSLCEDSSSCIAW
jgi:hypothetical protein